RGPARERRAARRRAAVRILCDVVRRLDRRRACPRRSPRYRIPRRRALRALRDCGCRTLRRARSAVPERQHTRGAGARGTDRGVRHVMTRSARKADWIDADEALARVLAAVAPLEVEASPIEAADGRVLARDVIAPVDQPPWDNSGMDGYAVRA